MPITDIIREFGLGLAKGFDLFLTSRHSYLEKVTTPHVDVR